MGQRWTSSASPRSSWTARSRTPRSPSGRTRSAAPRQVTLHLDLGASDRAAEATRLVALGATRLATGRGWIVLQDRDGPTFCATGQPPEAP
jgi:glyoxalase superfamily protein